MNAPSRRRGGSTLLVASLLLIIATLLELPLIGTTSTGGVFWVYAMIFLLAAIGYFVAGLLLAFGPGALLSRSAAAGIGVFAFGLLWLAAQVLYLFGTYLTPSDALALASTILSVLMLVAALIAALAIGIRGLYRGAARWSLLVAVVVSGVTGGIAGGSDSPALVTVLHVVSAVGLAVVGLTYLLRGSDIEPADAR